MVTEPSFDLLLGWLYTFVRLSIRQICTQPEPGPEEPFRFVVTVIATMSLTDIATTSALPMVRVLASDHPTMEAISLKLVVIP